ncbi:flippase [Acaryochloris sp. 'Moss Beach']|uniref:flippase n=1 Tax=Acaryochloris sp. 'Moss Beach' TaxID=2740837 RepID=UPI001F3C5D9A|nr:flippase [Acaryochloris sp. 'Moss Beach']UJB69467.1 flippase [Acaryochloris sp. 'Moss Beach']
MKQTINLLIERLLPLPHLNLKQVAKRTLASDLFQKISATFVVRVLLMGLGFVNSIILARILAPEGRGILAVATAVTAMGIQFGNLGLPTANTYTVSKDPTRLPNVLANSLVISLGIGTLGALVLGFIFRMAPEIAPVHGTTLTLALMAIPLGLAYMLCLNILVGMQKIRTFNQIEVGSTLISIGFVLIVIISQQITVDILLGASILASCITLTWLFINLRPQMNSALQPSFDLFKENLIYGIKAYTSTFLAFLVLKVDLLMINQWLGAEQAGLYSVAVAISNLVYLIPTTVGNIIFPKLCSIEDWKERYRLLKKVCQPLSLLMVFIISFTAISAYPLITILYGRSYTLAAQPLLWLLPGILVWSIESVFRKLLASDGYRIEIIYAWLAASLTNIVLNIFLIPSMGISGAAISSSLSILVVALVTMTTFYRDRKRQYV